MSSVPIQSIGTPLFYGVFFSVVLLLIAIDMLTLKKTGAHKVSTKEALTWSVVWVLVSLLFALWLYFELAGNPAYGPAVANEKTLAFLTGYVLEKALAVDNIFVFVMIFAYFKIPPQYQHRVLLYGVLGAIVLRMIMVFLGAVLGLRAMYFLLANIIDRFVYLKYGLAFVLTFIGIKMLIVEWYHIPVAVSLAVVFSALLLSVLVSWLHMRRLHS